MNNTLALAKLIASIAALIASLALAWIARNGLELDVNHREIYPNRPGAPIR